VGLAGDPGRDPGQAGRVVAWGRQRGRGVLFAVAWLVRRDQSGYDPTGVAFWLEVVAVLLALVTAWLGGELVERLGVGVDEGASLDAPSSLSGPAGRPRQAM
jgi:uncharacterized membrane protein